jgi:predicted unusual protein kinase regulating ubiquinone biosynthesis (AarF/ABC1/UbiB family)
MVASEYAVVRGYDRQDFYSNYKDDPYVKIPKVYPEYCGEQLLVMEWIDGVRCTDPEGIVAAGVDVAEFIRVGVISGLRQVTGLTPRHA